jgi:glycine hydroxymethyltransferase
MVEEDMTRIVSLIDKVLTHHDQDNILSDVKEEVNAWMSQFPLYK